MKKITAYQLIKKKPLESLSRAIDIKKMVHHQLYRLFIDEAEKHNLLELQEDSCAEEVRLKIEGYVISEKEHNVIMELIQLILHRPSYYRNYVYELKKIFNGEADEPFLHKQETFDWEKPSQEYFYGIRKENSDEEK